MPRKSKRLSADRPAARPGRRPGSLCPAGMLTADDVEAATRRFKKAIIERALGGELTHHLGYPPGGEQPEETPNHRNGTSAKTVLTDDGPLAIEVPRDRDGTFEPRLIGKHERRFTGFDDKILALYARGHDGARDSGVPRRDVCDRGVAGSDQHGHRRGGRRGHGLAGAAARADVSGRVLRCAARQDPRRSDRCGARRSIWRWPCCPMARATSSASGSSRPKARNSG